MISNEYMCLFSGASAFFELDAEVRQTVNYSSSPKSCQHEAILLVIYNSYSPKLS